MSWSAHRPFVNGGISAVIAEISTYPLDTVKTRLQVQGQMYDSRYIKLKYTGVLDTFTKIVRKEGMTALYFGIGPAVMRQAFQGMLRTGTYYSLKRRFAKTNQEILYVNFISAVTAGCASALTVNPIELIKIRMQVGTQNHPESLLEHVKIIYKSEGFLGFYKGATATMQRAVVLSVIGLPSYDYIKYLLTEPLGNNIYNHCTASFLSSFNLAVALCPFDVVKTRIMNQDKYKHYKMTNIPNIHFYTGPVDCLVRCVKTEGVSSLYRGFFALWMRLCPWNIISSVVYEILPK